jgi:alpha-1,3-rhamnosyl/mannosyltransferase
MRVVVNHLATFGRKTGIGHYTGQLLRCLRLQAGSDRIDAFPTGIVRSACQGFARVRPYLDPPTAATSRALQSPAHTAGLRGRLVQYLRLAGRTVVGGYFRGVCAHYGYDLYHEPNFIPFATDRPTLTTLHDLSVLLHPEWHPRHRVCYYERSFRRTLDQSVHFLAVSEFSRQEVIRVLGVEPGRVTRVYNGVRPGLKPLAQEKVAPVLHRLRLPERYLLYLGTIEPRKNVLTILRAFCALPDRLRSQCPLLLVGSWGWNSTEVASYLDETARHRGVVHLGYVADRDLAALYNGARALVYPSLYEGFGLPPLEMMACGGAVLGSTAGALVETIGRQAHLVAPEDVEGWRDAIARVVADDEWWRTLRRGARAVARPFTWDRSASETLAVYRALCGQREQVPARRRAG